MPKIFLMTANSNMPPLRLADEAIRSAFSEGSNFTIVEAREARTEDLINGLLDHRPEIVHFAGHGLGGADQAMVLARAGGAPAVVTAQDLTQIFENVPVKPHLVVLNACFSVELANSLVHTVEAVIGAYGQIADPPALQFVTTLYLGLGKSCPVKSAFELARVGLKTAGYDEGQVDIRIAKEANSSKLVFYARPELVASFVPDRSGKPKRAGNTYDVHLWLRGVEQHAESVFFQICDSSLRKKERTWEIDRTESLTFLTDDISTYGDYTVRATVWSRDRGVGVVSTLVDALCRYYGPHPKPEVARAIAALKAS